MKDYYLEKKFKRIRELDNSGNFLIAINELKTLIRHFEEKKIKRGNKNSRISNQDKLELCKKEFPDIYRLLTPEQINKFLE